MQTTVMTDIRSRFQRLATVFEQDGFRFDRREGDHCI